MARKIHAKEKRPARLCRQTANNAKTGKASQAGNMQAERISRNVGQHENKGG